MKFLKLSSVLITLLFLFSSFSTDIDKTYIGKWKGEDKGDIGFLTLTQDGYAAFEFGGKIMGGESYKHQGVDASMTYTIDTSSKPYAIDFIITNNTNSKELGRLIGIIEMPDANTMQMAMTFGGGTTRPTDFSKDAVTFSRYKE